MNDRSEKLLKSEFNKPNPQNCRFCNKLCHNTNSLKQHECRCRLNPNKSTQDQGQHLSGYSQKYRKGKTKDTCESIAKQVNTMKNKYSNGYVSPIKGRVIVRSYLYKEHNDEEISKWLYYISKNCFDIPEYETTNGPSGYKIISKMQRKDGNTVKITFEHKFIANILLNGELEEDNVVHHIDHNRANNDLTNLLIFKSSSDHKRFHASDFAYLLYDENTHLFSCIKIN